MKKKEEDAKVNRSHIALVAILSLFIFILAGALFYSSSPDKAAPTIDPCKCPCHKIHEKEVQRDISRRHEDREASRLMSAKESERMMQEQEEFCSQPFREFLEEYGNQD